MTAKDIERDMKQFVSGSSFITPGKLAQYLGQKNTTRVKKSIWKMLFHWKERNPILSRMSLRAFMRMAIG